MNTDGPNPEKARWFAQEVHAHEASLRSYLKGSFPTVRDVDDIVQESYLRMWTLAAARPVRSGRAFLFRVARNVAIDLIRRGKTSPIKSVTDLDALPVLEGKRAASEAACTQEEVELLAEAIDELPARCREILILRKLKGISQKEIAARLGISEQTVQVQAARGVKRCEAYLRKKGVGTPIRS